MDPLTIGILAALALIALGAVAYRYLGRTTNANKTDAAVATYEGNAEPTETPGLLETIAAPDLDEVIVGYAGDVPVVRAQDGTLVTGEFNLVRRRTDGVLSFVKNVVPGKHNLVFVLPGASDSFEFGVNGQGRPTVEEKVAAVVRTGVSNDDPTTFPIGRSSDY